MVSRPSWHRDYSYLLACVGQVREHLTRHLVGESIEALARTALEIYNRFDNRRRMGVEVIVLSMLVTKYSTWFEVPDKYHSVVFVLEMLVSCR